MVHLDAIEYSLDRGGFLRRVDEAAACEALDHRQRDIVAAAELRKQRLGFAVLRQHTDRDVRPDRVDGRGDGYGTTVNANLAALDLGHAEASEEEVELAHPL